MDRLASVQSPRGELVLRRRGADLELISNGTFLMDTSNGESERALANVALQGLIGRPRVLIAGLGFGFTLDATLSHDVAQVVLVELEPAVIAWNEKWWPLGAAALSDPRVQIVVDDFAHYLRAVDEPFDAVLVDIDNGPDWTVAEPNVALYAELLPDLRRAVRAAGGRLSVWSASASEGFAARLRRYFAKVTVHEVPVPRGEPDVLYLASA